MGEEINRDFVNLVEVDGFGFFKTCEPSGRLDELLELFHFWVRVLNEVDLHHDWDSFTLASEGQCLTDLCTLCRTECWKLRVPVSPADVEDACLNEAEQSIDTDFNSCCEL
jgi:hypothetical protein